MTHDATPGGGSAESVDTTPALLQRVRTGDKQALERLFERLLPVLRRVAHGRLPQRSRGVQDTEDLVQVVSLRTLPKLAEFDPRGKGSLVAYARRVLTNELRDEFRRLARTPQMTDLADLADELPSEDDDPLRNAIDAETLALYRNALARLTADEQDLILLSLEMDFSHAEVAKAMGRPSPNAARMAVARALARLAERMGWPEENA